MSERKATTAWAGLPRVLEGPRIVLQVLSTDHAGQLLRFHRENSRHLKPFEPKREQCFYTLDEHHRLVDMRQRMLNLGLGVGFGVFLDNVLVGKLNISNVVRGSFDSAFLGYAMDHRHTGQGYMKEAVALALDWAFYQLELHRVEASTLVDNLPSQGVLLANGFQFLGLNRRYLYINGVWQDHYTYYKLKEDHTA